MGIEEDRKRLKQLLNKETVGWRKERLAALNMSFEIPTDWNRNALNGSI